MDVIRNTRTRKVVFELRALQDYTYGLGIVQQGIVQLLEQVVDIVTVNKHCYELRPIEEGAVQHCRHTPSELHRLRQYLQTIRINKLFKTKTF